MSTSTKKTSPQGEPTTTPHSARPPRIGVIDALRGLACVFMITWHCADSWLLPSLRDTPPFDIARFVGGFAAPLFLWLAGLSLALMTPLHPTAKQTQTSLVRALWVVVVGYGLKLCAWTVDHTAVRDAANWLTLLIAFPSIFALGWSTREARLERERAVAFVLGAIGLFIAYSHLDGTTRGSVVLARLDVLHGIGAALFVTTLLLALAGRIVRSESQRVLFLIVLALLVALITPHWIGGSLAPIPTRIADYIARLREPFAESGARFSLFPWLGHALSGAAFGTLLSREANERANERAMGREMGREMRRAKPELGETELPFKLHPLLVFAMALLVMFVVFEGGYVAPHLLGRVESLRPLMRLLFFGALALSFACVLSWIGNASRPTYDALRTLGRSSLLVYGAHLEFAYGLLGLSVRGRLSWPLYVLGIVLVTGLMLVLVRLVEHLEKRFMKPASQATTTK